jgi:hypothetical protein
LYFLSNFSCSVLCSFFRVFKIIEDCLTEITEDLSFIRSNERTVFDYEKDKRELFDKVPELRADKATLFNSKSC